MKSITLHNLEDALAQKIEEYAREQNTSLNRAAQGLLRQALGLEKGRRSQPDFREFSGIWSENEYKKFNAALADFESVHPDDWK